MTQKPIHSPAEQVGALRGASASTPLTVHYIQRQKMCSKCQVRKTHWRFDFLGVRFRVCHHCMNPLEQAAMNLVKFVERDSRPKRLATILVLNEKEIPDAAHR